MHSRISFCLVAITLVLAGCDSSKRGERPVSNDPYSVLTEKIRLDWTTAMATIRKGEEEGFKAHLMRSHLLTSPLFDSFRTAAGLLPDADSRLAAIFYTYPDKPAGVRDACIVVGPFQVKTGSEVVYSLGERSETFPVRPDKPYYLYVELTNEEDGPGGVVLPTYRVKSPIMPLEFQDAVGKVTGTYSRWKNECHIQTFSEDGVRMKDSILSIWSSN